MSIEFAWRHPNKALSELSPPPPAPPAQQEEAHSVPYHWALTMFVLAFVVFATVPMLAKRTTSTSAGAHSELIFANLLHVVDQEQAMMCFSKDVLANE